MYVGELETYKERCKTFKRKMYETIEEYPNDIDKNFTFIDIKDRINDVTNDNMYYTYSELFCGYMGLMCPHCKHYEIVKMQYCHTANIRSRPDEKGKDVYDLDRYIYPDTGVYDRCDNCDKQIRMIQIDPEIIEAVSLLNQKGYYTKFCCSGHAKEDVYSEHDEPGYIYFYNKDLLSEIGHLIPLTWDIDMGEYEDGRFIIRTEYFNHDEAMIDILDFAKSIPDRKLFQHGHN